MESIDLTTLKTRAGEVLDMAKKEAVTVSRYGKPAAVIISPEMYQHFEKLEDDYWRHIIEARRREGGYLSNEESLKALQDLLTK